MCIKEFDLGVTSGVRLHFGYNVNFDVTFSCVMNWASSLLLIDRYLNVNTKAIRDSCLGGK